MLKIYDAQAVSANTAFLLRALMAFFVAIAFAFFISTNAKAAMTQESIHAKLKKEYGVEVLKVEPFEVGGRPAFAVTVMKPGGNWNGAYQVNTIVVDTETGALVIQYGMRGGQLQDAAPAVSHRTHPLTSEDK